jgi:molybdopterin biosynthesis enzyme
MLSVEGRKDYVRVQVEEGKVIKVMPQGAAMLFSAVRADGFVVISEEAVSLKTGEMVTVYLYEPR